jgi:AcrR family transcriptional regulator
MARPRLISDEQILSTMRACVLDKGPHVSLDLVAEQLHVTGPALLKRFGSREELMLRALRPPETPDFLPELERGPDAASPLEAQLEAIFVRFWGYIAQVMPCVTALRESGIPPERLWVDKSRGPLRTTESLVKWLQQGHTQGLLSAPNLESVALAMMGAIQSRAMTAHLLKQSFSLRSQRAYLKDIAQLFTRALAPTSSPPVAAR